MLSWNEPRDRGIAFPGVWIGCSNGVCNQSGTGDTRRLAVMNLALRGSPFLQREAKTQVASEAKDSFRKDDDVRWRVAFRTRGLTS
jgi:uncharacterized protein YijF (DUF1287 family)